MPKVSAANNPGRAAEAARHLTVEGFDRAVEATSKLARLTVGPCVIAPVGNDRAWAIPAYAEALRNQTLPPSACVFLLSPGSKEVAATIRAADWGEAAVYLCGTSERFYDRASRSGDPSDPNRCRHFVRLRNGLRSAALQTGACWFLSIDTDIILEDPDMIQRLRDHLWVPELDNPDSGPRPNAPFDVVAPTAYLHPLEDRSDCFNVAWWVAGEPATPTRVWRRADRNDFLVRHSPVPIDVPLAVFAISRAALATCRYRFHESGEDLGFADSLDRHGLSVGWVKELHARHVWDESRLAVAADA